MHSVLKVLFVAAATGTAVAAVIWYAGADGWIWAASFCADWFVMAWMAALVRVTGFEFSTGYYGAWEFETDGHFYQQLGVPWFGRLIRRGPLHICAPGLEWHGRKQMRELERQMRGAEAIHVLAFLTALGLPVFALMRGRTNAALWALLFNTAINVYPVMLQRYNRLRIHGLRTRQDRLSRD